MSLVAEAKQARNEAIEVIQRATRLYFAAHNEFAMQEYGVPAIVRIGGYGHWLAATAKTGHALYVHDGGKGRKSYIVRHPDGTGEMFMREPKSPAGRWNRRIQRVDLRWPVPLSNGTPNPNITVLPRKEV